MEIWISRRTYNSCGGHVTLGLVGSLLEIDAPDFGSAITELEIYTLFKSTKPAKKSLEDYYQNFHESLSSYPTTVFHRKKQRFELQYFSQIATAEETSKYGPPQLELLLTFFQELREQLQILKRKIRKQDDFDVERFLQWVDDKEAELPNNQAELEALKEKADQFEKAKFAAMDEWQKLAIDWCDFHPDARSVLDDTFFWDVCNDFAPNGNDTGADLLSFFQDWRKKHRKASSRIFFTDLMIGWGVNQNPGPDDNFSIETYDESTVALAFAHLKIEAACPVWIRDEAIRSIERQESIIRENHASWDHFNERMETFAKVRKKLESCPTIDG